MPDHLSNNLGRSTVMGLWAAPLTLKRLGTQFGERRWSPVDEVDFERADPARPAAVISLRYDDHAGLVAKGVPVPPRWVPEPPPRRWVPPPPAYAEERAPEAFPGR